MFKLVYCTTNFENVDSRINTVNKNIATLLFDANDVERIAKLEDKVVELEDTVIPELQALLEVATKQSFENRSDIIILQRNQTKLFKDCNGIQRQIGTLTEEVSGLKIITFRLKGDLTGREDGIIIWIDGFPLGKTILSQKGEKQFSKAILRLKGCEVFRLEGYSDNNPSPNNHVYGLGRATLLKSDLEKAGIPVVCEPTYGGSTNSSGDCCVQICARRIQPKKDVSANSPNILYTHGNVTVPSGAVVISEGEPIISPPTATATISSSSHNSYPTKASRRGKNYGNGF